MPLDKPYGDIPGTTIFDATQARRGYHMNQFFMTLMKPENRTRFLANERAVLDEWPMKEEQKQAVLGRDYNRVIALGGNVYFFSKLFFTDQMSFEQGAALMSGVSQDEYRSMMIAGGRSPDGNRYKKDDDDG